MLLFLDISFWILLAACSYPFAVYPVLVKFFAAFAPPKFRPDTPIDKNWTVSVIVAVHNGEDRIAEKIENTLSLDFPWQNLELIVTCDGCSDNTVNIAQSYEDTRVRVIKEPTHKGKNKALNRAFAAARGDFLLFSDVDAILPSNTLSLLLPWFTDPHIGGVGGGKRFTGTENILNDAQQSYNSYQQSIKTAESRLYSTGTAEGKIHLIRRELYQPISGGEADDLHNLLSVIERGKRFVYAQDAFAYIPIPSVNRIHEIRRRRRIVRGSLAAQWTHRSLFNPFAYGWYSWILYSHKFGRRLAAPLLFSLLPLAAARLFLHPFDTWRTIPQWMTVLAFCIAGIGALAEHLKFPLPGPFRLVNRIWYFVLGNWATMLGFFDVLLGKQESGVWSTATARKELDRHSEKETTHAPESVHEK